jgi:hypothetical protein
MSSKLLLALTVAAAAVGRGPARCANSCSGHGVCREHDVCTCYANWQGNDCSDRTCPFALSWGDAPYGHDAAHYYAECSSQGLCDRKTGECQCFDGYEGDACRRLKCPDDCSGHGRCRTTWETAQTTTVGDYYSTKGEVLDKAVIDGKNSYTNWDAHKTQSCVCDPGFTGINCASRMCPRGNDPLTTEDADGVTEVTEVQTIYVGDANSNGKSWGAHTSADWVNGADSNSGTAGGFFTLTFTDSYGMEWETRPIPATDHADPLAATLNAYHVEGGARTTQHYLRDALKALPNHAIDDVEVSWAAANNMNEYRVTFTSAANAGRRNLLKCNYKGCNDDGCQPRYIGIQSETGVSTTTGPQCSVRGQTFYNINGFEDASSSGNGKATSASDGRVGTGEDAECSNRGLCDGESGLCACFPGYTGESCSIQTILV